jgi:1,3-beta-glucan synthase
VCGCFLQVGFREWIFSDVSGALGTFAAAAEFAFGTTVQRMMSYPGRVRMHYGHPDVFNKLHIMTRVSAVACRVKRAATGWGPPHGDLETHRSPGSAHPPVCGRVHHLHGIHLHVATQAQGGVSKATRQLHISEDVFGGMNHTLRGGQIKYREYISCGKVIVRAYVEWENVCWARSVRWRAPCFVA